MDAVVKILVGAAILCLLIWFGLMVLGVKPLTVHAGADVIYGEGEDFFSDAVAYQKLRNSSFLLVHLPHARPAFRWVAVDFRNRSITLAGPVRKLGSFTYWLKTDGPGEQIADQAPVGAWYWRFTDQVSAFSGNGFSCRVRRIAD